MLKKTIIAISLGMALTTSVLAASIVVNVTPEQWQDWRWREDHRSEWRVWHKKHNRDWIEWRTNNRHDWDRWCYYHPRDCR